MPSPRKKKPKRPPPPPASLVRLLQTDAAVLEYFTALQDALAADVDKWKQRAQQAEQARAHRSTNTVAKKPPPAAATKRKRKQAPAPPPVIVTTKTAKRAPTAPPKAVDDAAFHFLDSDDDDSEDDVDANLVQTEVRRKTPQESQEEEEHQGTTSAKDQHMLSFLQDDHDSSSSTSSSSNDDDDQQLQDKMDQTMLEEAAECMLQALEIEWNEQVLVEDADDDAATPRPTSEAPTPDGTEAPEPIFRLKPRKDTDVADEIRRRFADQMYNPQLVEALQLVDATARFGIVDGIAHHPSVSSWLTVSLQAWRGQYQQSLQALLDCLVQDNVRMVLAALDACFNGSSNEECCWISNYIGSIFGDEAEATIMLEALAFCIGQTVALLRQQSDEEETETTLAFTRWKEIAVKHEWLSQTGHPSELIPRVLGLGNVSSSVKRSVWLAISQVVLVRTDSKDVPDLQDSNGDDDTLGLLLCHVERQISLRSSSSSTLPNNLLPSSLACSVTLADGHATIACIQSLLSGPLPETNTRLWDLVQASCIIPTLRVINLERRSDRLATFVRQALRQGLLVIKGVTPLLPKEEPDDDDDPTALEHGSYAYDGSGRLVEAMRRITEAVGEKEQWKKLVAEEWCPNDLKPFDRDAPAAESLVGTTPSEKACALSHVSCWKGIVRVLDLSQNPTNDFAEDATQLRLWRSPQNIARLFKVAGFAQGRALLPKNEDMAPAPVCIVMEDDAILVDGFKEKLAAVLKDLPRDFHYCSLGYSRPRSAPIVPLTGSVGVPTMLWYLTGYCVSLAGAQYLLDSLPVVGPVDSWIGLKMAHENWRDSEWGTRLGVGAHAQPDAYPNRAALAALLKFHAYCAVPSLCCQPVGKAAAATTMRGTVVAPTAARRNWRLRDTDIVYSGDLAKLVV